MVKEKKYLKKFAIKYNNSSAIKILEYFLAKYETTDIQNQNKKISLNFINTKNRYIEEREKEQRNYSYLI